MFCRPSRSIAGVRSGGSPPKKKPIDGCTSSGLPLGCMCSSHDEIRSGLQRPRQALWQQRRRLSGSPAEEVTVGVSGRVGDQAVVAGRRILLVEPPRRRRAIDADVGVVHDAVPGAELEAAHETPLADRQRDRRRCGRRRCLPSSAYTPAAERRDRVRRAASRRFLPASAAGPPGCPRGARLRPLLNRGDVGRREPILADEVAVPGLGLPRRHGARPRDGSDLRGAAPHFLVGQDAERTRTVGLMAGSAVTKQDRGDILRERHLRGVRPEARRDDCSTDQEARQPPRHQTAAYRNRIG